VPWFFLVTWVCICRPPPGACSKPQQQPYDEHVVPCCG
jgi:hypothetical protein